MTHHKVLLTASAAACLALSAPAWGQSHMNMPPGMHMPGMTMPMPKKSAAKKPTAKKTVTKKTTSKAAKSQSKASAKKPTAKAAKKRSSSSAKKQGQKRANPHAGHDMSSMPGMDMPAGHDMSKMPKTAPGKTADPHAGHDMSSMPGMAMPPGQSMDAMPGMNMPGHDMSNMPMSTNAEVSGTDLPAGNAPAPPVPTDHAAARVYSPQAMAMGLHHLQEFHGRQKFGQVLVNLAEYQARKGRDGYEWDAQGWYGGDINRLWVKTQGDGAFGKPVERAEVQALYSHAIGPYFNLQGGARYDFKPNPSRVYATVGVEGLAPSFFDFEGAVFLSNKGELLARAEGYYDQRITQRLILQPRVELNFAAQNTRELQIGSGLSNAELGLRLRYDVRREFAPYVGVQYDRSFGDTRRFRRLAGEDPGGWSFIAGVRTWF